MVDRPVGPPPAKPAGGPSPAAAGPRLSIGVPVYNGQRYLGRTLDALLGQTFHDFELIISDNGSTDATEPICREYAQRDPRIRYFRADRNEGVVRNFNRCVELARGALFKFQAADDTCAPTLLEKCVAALDANPGAVLAFARTMIIDEEDRPVRVHDYDVDATDARPHVRFARLINLHHRRHYAQEVYGVVRRAALVSVPVYEPFVRTDSILLVRLALLGKFVRVDEPLFFNREHADRSVQLVPGRKAAQRSRLAGLIGSGPVPPPEFWNRELTGKISFPEWRILEEYHRSLRLVPLSSAERAGARWALARFSLRHLPKLARDLIIAAEHLLLGRPA